MTTASDPQIVPRQPAAAPALRAADQGVACPGVRPLRQHPARLRRLHVVSEAVQQCAGEPFRPEDLGPLVERQVGGDQDGAPFVALAEDLEEQLRTGGG